MKISNFVFILCFLFSAKNLAANEYQSHESIIETARDFTNQQFKALSDTNVRINFGNIDPRLKFDRCSKALQAFLPSGARLEGHSTIGISCPAEPKWTYYLPVKYSKFQSIVVTTKTLLKGQRISQNDIKLIEVDVSQLRQSALTSVDEALGSAVKRTIRSGRAVTKANICTICKGDSVKIVAKKQSISVEVAGIALQDGISGDLITVRNNASKREIEARVASAGKVFIIF